MDHPDFIEVTENALSADTCRALIARFEQSRDIARGATGSGVDVTMKDSWDIGISSNAQWADAQKALNAAMARGLFAYMRKYPYLVLGPLKLQMRDAASGALRLIAPEDIITMDEKHLLALMNQTFRPGTINLQKYLADQGGYPRWHCEVYPDANKPDVYQRALLWTIYLNDEFDEGETEFLHQQRKITPKTGSLLIAPSSFTHTHRGNMPKHGDKYIATSWILFQRPEVLYGAQQQQSPKQTANR